MFCRQVAIRAVKPSLLKHSQLWHIRCRQRAFSSVGKASPETTDISTFYTITSELDRLGPRFDIDSNQITIVNSPKEFYQLLKNKIRQSQRRIFLSTLYIGTSEVELVSCLREALINQPSLKISILTDALRGTRESPAVSCASLLAPLVADFPDRVEVRMYHTPNLTGVRKKYIPKRINEGWGLQHMKMYGFDDEIILSGANLSNDYFTNRQDRYHLISSKQVTGYFAQIHDNMCTTSFSLSPDFTSSGYKLTWPDANPCPSPLADPLEYKQSLRKIFIPLTQPPQISCDSANPSKISIYPLLIIPDTVNTELPALRSLIGKPFPADSSYFFTAGYFNPHPEITSSLIKCSRNGTRGTVLTASPWANGFYGSKGVSGMLPAAYTLLARQFLKTANNLAPNAIELREWRLGTVGRPHAWTYHAKGLWVTLGSAVSGLSNHEGKASEAQSGAIATIIGSSNYTVRSYSLDTEVGAIIITNDGKLKEQLQRERNNLLEHTRAVTVSDLSEGERRVGLKVRLAMWLVKIVGGSL